MVSCKTNRYKINRPGFFTLLGILVACLIVLLLYFSTYMSLYTDFFQPVARYTDPNIMPWDEKWKILGFPHEKPYLQQPQLTEYFPQYKTQIKYYGESRGDLELKITPEGKVTGSLGGEFETKDPPIHFNLMGRDSFGNFQPRTFEGKIVPAKIYLDEYGQDKSLLYIFAEGAYRIKGTNLISGKETSSFGLMYITGWIDVEYKIIGKVFFRPHGNDPRPKTIYDFVVFDWTAAPLD